LTFIQNVFVLGAKVRAPFERRRHLVFLINKKVVIGSGADPKLLLMNLLMNFWEPKKFPLTWKVRLGAFSWITAISN